MSKKPAGWFIDLCKLIGFYNSDGEIEKICNAVDIDYQELKGLKIEDQVQEIAGTMIFRNQLDKLIKYLRKNRPRVQPLAYHDISLNMIETQADAAFRLGDPLLQFYGGGRVLLPDKGKTKLWYHELSNALENYYSDDEFRQMCGDLSLNYNYFSGMKKPKRAQEMVGASIQYGLLGKIIHYCQTNRPRVQPLSNQSIQWGDIEARAKKAFSEGNGLHDPILAKRIKEGN